MALSRREWLKAASLVGMAGALPGFARAQGLEKSSLTIAVGGQSLIYYLPLSVAHLKGYFRDEGVDVQVVDFAGGSKALQAVVGGSADVVSGAFEHTINLQSKGQFYRAFVQQGQAPMIVLAVSKKTMGAYASPADLKGKKIGVTAPGSSTNMMASFFLAQHGVKPSDVSFVGVGAGAGAITAIRSGQIDAMSNLDPVVSTLLKEDAVRIIADTRTLKDTQQIFGGNMPSGCLYASQDFIDRNPKTTQALANAMVRADRWIQSVSLDDIANLVPKAYLLGDPELYKLALEGNKEALSPDGMVPEGGPQTALNALAGYVPGFKKDEIDVSRIWTNDFVIKANQKFPHG